MGPPSVQAPDADQLERFVAERGLILLRTANLLTGSQQAAEDLLQPRLSGCSNTGTRSARTPRGTCAGSCTTWLPTAGDAAV
jgi:hypothetical protein